MEKYTLLSVERTAKAKGKGLEYIILLGKVFLNFQIMIYSVTDA